jgi:hypothetical protein
MPAIAHRGAEKFRIPTIPSFAARNATFLQTGRRPEAAP